MAHTAVRIDLHATPAVTDATAADIASAVAVKLANRTGQPSSAVTVITADAVSFEPVDLPAVFDSLFNGTITTPAAPVSTGHSGNLTVAWTDQSDATILGYIVTLLDNSNAVVTTQFVLAGVQAATFTAAAAAGYKVKLNAVRGYKSSLSTASNTVTIS